MAAQRRIRADAGEPATGRIRRRRPRPGQRRSINLCLCAEHAMWLTVAAARGLTTPAEIAMDLIDGARRRRGGEAAAVEDAA